MARVTVPLGVLSTPFHTLHDFPPEEQWHKNPKKAERAAFTWKRFSEWLDFAKEDLIEKGLDLSAAREAERLRKRLLLSVLRQRKLGEGGTVEVGEPIRKKFLHGPALVGRLGPQALLNASFIGGVVSFVGAAALVIAEANRKKAGLEGVNPVLLHSAPQFFFSGLLGMAPKVFYGPPRKGLKKFFNSTAFNARSLMLALRRARTRGQREAIVNSLLFLAKEQVSSAKSLGLLPTLPDSTSTSL